LQLGSDDPSSGKPTRPTVGGHFRQQVKDLRAKLDITAPHYVRCIKPNDLMVPKMFDAAMVAEQLRCGGILQAVGVTRKGFTLNHTHVEFVKRYSVLAGQQADKIQGSKAILAKCQELTLIFTERLQKHFDSEKSTATAGTSDKGHVRDDDDDDEPLIRIGRSRMLLKHHAFEALETWLCAIQNSAATQLNKMFRRHLSRIAFLSVRQAFRLELRGTGLTFEEWFKENREMYYGSKENKMRGVHIPVSIVARRRALLQQRVEEKFRRQPKKVSLEIQNAAWIVVDGLWERNPNYVPGLDDSISSKLSTGKTGLNKHSVAIRCDMMPTKDVAHTTANNIKETEALTQEAAVEEVGDDASDHSLHHDNNQFETTSMPEGSSAVSAQEMDTANPMVAF
jgi:hypothetical protein